MSYPSTPEQLRAQSRLGRLWEAYQQATEALGAASQHLVEARGKLADCQHRIAGATLEDNEALANLPVERERERLLLETVAQAEREHARIDEAYGKAQDQWAAAWREYAATLYDWELCGQASDDLSTTWMSPRTQREVAPRFRARFEGELRVLLQ